MLGNWVKILSKLVPIVSNDTVDSTNGVIGYRQKVQGYVVTYGAIGL